QPNGKDGKRNEVRESSLLIAEDDVAREVKREEDDREQRRDGQSHVVLHCAFPLALERDAAPHYCNSGCPEVQALRAEADEPITLPATLSERSLAHQRDSDREPRKSQVATGLAGGSG